MYLYRGEKMQWKKCIKEMSSNVSHISYVPSYWLWLESVHSDQNQKWQRASLVVKRQQSVSSNCAGARALILLTICEGWNGGRKFEGESVLLSILLLSGINLTMNNEIRENCWRKPWTREGKTAKRGQGWGWRGTWKSFLSLPPCLLTLLYSVC